MQKSDIFCGRPTAACLPPQPSSKNNISRHSQVTVAESDAQMMTVHKAPQSPNSARKGTMRAIPGFGAALAAIFTLAGLAHAGPNSVPQTTPPLKAHTTVLPRTEGFWYVVPLARCWTPKAADLRHLEADLPQALSRYYRQYLGITEKGKRLILINGFSAQVAPESTGGKYDWHSHMVFVTGGGNNYFHATYDPKTRKFDGLEYNSPLG